MGTSQLGLSKVDVILSIFSLIIFLLLMGWMSRRVRGRTSREFVSTEDIWSKVDAWAAQTGHKLVEQDQASRLYKRDTGYFAPQMVKMTAMSDKYNIEAWVRMSWFQKVITLGLVPDEIVIDKGGLWGSFPRSKARNDVNRLLTSLGAPPI